MLEPSPALTCHPHEPTSWTSTFKNTFANSPTGVHVCMVRSLGSLQIQDLTAGIY